MKGYVIAQIDVHDFQKYKPYMLEVQETIEACEGRYVIRNGTKQPLEGIAPQERLVIIEFPSVERAREWYESQRYAAIKPIRTGASTGTVFIVEGVG